MLNNYNYDYVKQAEKLFRPFGDNSVTPQTSKFGFLKRLIAEFVHFIPKQWQKRNFIHDFDKKVAAIGKEPIQPGNPAETLDQCAKKLEQLNVLNSVYLLVAKTYGHKVRIEYLLKITNAMLDVQGVVNRTINLVEDQKKADNQKATLSEAPLPVTNEHDIPAQEVPVSEPRYEDTHDTLEAADASEEVMEFVDPSDALEESDTSDEAQEYFDASSMDSSTEESGDAMPPAVVKETSPTLWERVVRLSGIKDIGEGIRSVREGNYASGLKGIAVGSVRLCLLGALTAGVAQQLFAEKTYDRVVDNRVQIFPREVYSQHSILIVGGPIPVVEQAQILSEIYSTPTGRERITLVTAYNGDIRDYAQYVIPNQRDYAAKQGYDYIEYYGDMAQDGGVKRAPYWTKIVALNDRLQKTKEGEWLAWLDASAIFTNTNDRFDRIIEKYGSGVDLIVTNDPMVPINNAVFLVRNTPWTKEWIKEVWARVDLARGGEGNCWSWGQPICHYEQQAMTELWERNPEVKEHTRVIPNNEMNSFYRYTHYDSYRNMQLNYDGDAPNTKWHAGHFICKVTGMDRDRRLAIVKYVAQNCIDKHCERKEF